MESTIDRPTEKARRPWRPLADVIEDVTDLHRAGLMRGEIAARLGMDPGCRGALVAALRRADRRDLLAAITPPDWTDVRREAALAEHRRRTVAA